GRDRVLLAVLAQDRPTQFIVPETAADPLRAVSQHAKALNIRVYAMLPVRKRDHRVFFRVVGIYTLPAPVIAAVGGLEHDTLHTRDLTGQLVLKMHRAQIALRYAGAFVVADIGIRRKKDRFETSAHGYGAQAHTGRAGLGGTFRYDTVGRTFVAHDKAVLLAHAHFMQVFSRGQRYGIATAI